MAMSVPIRLSGLTQRQLKYSAYLLGLPTSGIKKSLVLSIGNSLRWTPPRQKTKQRIVSVDMGIRNLAYCVMEVSSHDGSVKTSVAVKHWKRTDLVQNGSQDSEHVLDDAGSMPSPLTFQPPTLSRIAYAITKELLDHQPDIILIEKQRWRSGGAAGVQQWTIRVNSLENMLWACLRTLEETQATTLTCFPTAHSVDPKRVAGFFPRSPRLGLRPSRDLLFSPVSEDLDVFLDTTAGSVTKAEKIGVVESWLEDNRHLILECEGQASDVAESLRSRMRPRRRKDDCTTVEKLDDLADCLLQGVTWHWWQENRRQLLDILSDAP